MLLLAWNASNIAGHSKKVTANALTLVAFCLGNILGTQTFQDKEAPGYRSGKVGLFSPLFLPTSHPPLTSPKQISIIATLAALCLVVIILRLYNDKLNRRNASALAGMDESERERLREKTAFADRTDRGNVFFEYTH